MSLAIASATQDTRFTPVEPSELGGLTIEISVLTPLQRIHSPAEFHLGRFLALHGMTMKDITLVDIRTPEGW